MSIYYIAHHGIMGQRWGVRRYQNKDGSYTEAGKKRYNWAKGDNRKYDITGAYGQKLAKKDWDTYIKYNKANNDRMQKYFNSDKFKSSVKASREKHNPETDARYNNAYNSYLDKEKEYNDFRKQNKKVFDEDERLWLKYSFARDAESERKAKADVDKFEQDHSDMMDKDKSLYNEQNKAMNNWLNENRRLTDAVIDDVRDDTISSLGLYANKMREREAETIVDSLIENEIRYIK